MCNSSVFVRLLGSYGLLMFFAFFLFSVTLFPKRRPFFSFAISTQASAQEELAKLKNEQDSSKNAEVWAVLGGVVTDK